MAKNEIVVKTKDVVKNLNAIRYLVDEVIDISTKFIDKVESDKARSIETYRDLVGLRKLAIKIKKNV